MEHAADRKGGRQRLRVGHREREGHHAALRETGEQRLADRGARGSQSSERRRESIRLPPHHERIDVVAYGVVPEVPPAARMAIGENEAGAAAVPPEQLHQVSRVSAHHVFEVANAGDLVLAGGRRRLLRRRHRRRSLLRCRPAAPCSDDHADCEEQAPCSSVLAEFGHVLRPIALALSAFEAGSEHG